MTSCIDILSYGCRFIVFVVTNCYGFFSYVMWMVVLLPVRILYPSLFWQIESTLFRSLQSFVIVWIATGGYGVVEAGDDISMLSDSETVLMCNHQSTADVPLLMLALWQKGQCMGSAMWIMDWLFKFTNFGIISSIRRDFFIKQGKDTRDQQGPLLAEHLKQYYVPQSRKWIILFPEGGFLRKRLETSQSYAKKYGYPVLQNVTLPRIGALKSIIDTVGTLEHDSTTESRANGNCEVDPERPLKWLIDMTIGYQNGEGEPPDMFGMCLGYRAKQDMYVHYRAYPLSRVPHDSEGLLKWLYDRYEEKDQMLNHFYENGYFPKKLEGSVLPVMLQKRVTYDWMSVILLQIFFITSSYFHYKLFVQPVLSLLF